MARPPALRRLVYVSTYDKTEGLYHYECEDSGGPMPEDYVTNETGENVDLPTLIAVMERHLDAT